MREQLAGVGSPPPSHGSGERTQASDWVAWAFIYWAIFFPHLFSDEVSAVLKLTKSARLGSKDCLPPQCWGYKHKLACLAFVCRFWKSNWGPRACTASTLPWATPPTPSPYTYFLSSICYTPDCEFENKIIILWIQNLNVLKLLIFNDFQVGSKCIRKRFKKSATELLTIQPWAIKMLLTFFPILPIIQVIKL